MSSFSVPADTKKRVKGKKERTAEEEEEEEELQKQKVRGRV